MSKIPVFGDPNWIKKAKECTCRQCVHSECDEDPEGWYCDLTNEMVWPDTLTECPDFQVQA